MEGRGKGIQKKGQKGTTGNLDLETTLARPCAPAQHFAPESRPHGASLCCRAVKQYQGLKNSSWALGADDRMLFQ